MNGDILKKLRLESNLTQEQLSKKINLSPSTIRMIEIGKRGGSEEVVNKIADFFNVSLDYLNGRTEERTTIDQDKGQLIDDFLDTLIEEGLIKDPNNIDDEIAKIILNRVQSQIGYKMLKKKGK